LSNTQIVSSFGVIDDGGEDPLMGYSILQAENINTAVKTVADIPM
jgi:hypothetical protein